MFEFKLFFPRSTRNDSRISNKPYQYCGKLYCDLNAIELTLTSHSNDYSLEPLLKALSKSHPFITAQYVESSHNYYKFSLTNQISVIYEMLPLLLEHQLLFMNMNDSTAFNNPEKIVYLDPHAYNNNNQQVSTIVRQLADRQIQDLKSQVMILFCQNGDQTELINEQFAMIQSQKTQLQWQASEIERLSPPRYTPHYTESTPSRSQAYIPPLPSAPPYEAEYSAPSAPTDAANSAPSPPHGKIWSRLKKKCSPGRK